MRRTRNPILPLLAILCGLASVGFIVWALQRETPTRFLHSTTEMPVDTPSDEGSPAQSEATEAVPETPVEATPMTESAPEAAPKEETPPPSPEPIPEEELTGPLPARAPEEDAAATHAASALLPAPGSISITPPSGPPSSPAALAEQPHNWPGRVVLSKSVSFPIILNGVQAGTVLAPKGSPVILKKVLADGQVVIEWGGSITTVGASSTDLMVRVSAVAAARTQESPMATDSTARPTANAPTPQSSAPMPAVPPEAAKPKLNITVTRNRRSEGAIGGPTRQSWVFKVRVQNPTTDSLPNLNGRLFVFTKGKGEELIVAANEELATDLKANSEVTLEPPPLALGPDSAYDSYAVVLRDGSGTIVGSLSFREAATKNWKALEAVKAGSIAPGQR